MTQAGEARYVPPTLDKERDDPPNKKPLTIRIILLCDGTNNNKENIAEREKFEARTEAESASHKAFGVKGSSYDNGRTNIATMEPHVESGVGKGGYSFVVKVYVEGQGTLAFNKDEKAGLAVATGLTGVYQRARKGIADALAKLQREFLKDRKPSRFFIKKVDVDVFGFSRGAATARHAIHVLTTTETMFVNDPVGYGAQEVVITQPLFERLRLLGYSEMREDRVKIIFAGLYDTVVSVMASQLAPAWIANNARDQTAVKKAKFALHLAAADEHRSDFPLHRITSATEAGTGAEYFLPGVHSDIGGSYNLANELLIGQGEEKRDAVIRELRVVGSYEECAEERQKLIDSGCKYWEVAIEPITNDWNSDDFRLYEYRQISGLEYARPSDEVNRVINRGRVADLKKDMTNLINDGWYINDHSVTEIKIETDYVATAARVVTAIISGSPKSGKLIVNRFGIHSSYCHIPLKFMVEHARKQAIPIRGELDQRIQTILNEVPEFASLEASLRGYMAKKGTTGSKPSDWTEIEAAKENYPDIKKLRHKHLHMSSAFTIPVIDPGFTPRFEGDRRRRFYYEG